MRRVFETQMRLGAVDISRIELDLRSRDEIPKLLLGLKHIFCDRRLRSEVFKMLKEIVPEGTDPGKGRRGMDLWKIFVLGTLRLNCNWDYDKLQEMANKHRSIREMLGHGIFDRDRYALQTLKDNVSLLTAEMLDRINEVVVRAGHKLVGKKRDEILKGRCDSFVLETDVHYPTDINLVLDAVQKVITLLSALCFSAGMTLWRKGEYNLRKIKKLYRSAQNRKHSSSQDAKKKAMRDELIREAHQTYIEVVTFFVRRARGTVTVLRDQGLAPEEKLMELEGYLAHAERQIDQIRRRVIEGQQIPHDEKVFSIYEEHTEWICKGKAGVPQELGLRVCILEDQYGFILHHHVMERVTDEKVTILMVKEAKKRFSDLDQCSFDKGFHSLPNRKALEKELGLVVLPKKGKLGPRDKELESSPEFLQARRAHSAVESGIHALECHGLDRCPDHGIERFKRYVALAIVARNLQILGDRVQKKELKRTKRIERLAKRRKEQPGQMAA